LLPIVPLGKKGSTGIPILSIFISVVCIIVYAFANQESDQLALAFYPEELDPLKMLTSVFTHGSLWHLAVNLFFFYGFSRTIETQLTAVGYLLAFVVFVLITNLSFALTADADTPTIGLSGVVWGYMGMFLFRYPKDDITCWFIRTIEVPAFLFILAFLALDIAAFRHGDNAHVNYAAHFSGFIAGALYKLAFWKIFTTEAPPEPRKRPVLGPSRAPARLPRR
jgi:membrane associated rhomboid family serine protease